MEFAGNLHTSLKYSRITGIGKHPKGPRRDPSKVTRIGDAYDVRHAEFPEAKYVFSRIAKSQLRGKDPVKRLAVWADMHLRLGVRTGQVNGKAL